MLTWVHKDKGSSLASQLTCLVVSQIHIFTNIYKQDPDFLPGIAMGEIDKMSRMEDGESLDSLMIQMECPSLLPSLKIDQQTTTISTFSKGKGKFLENPQETYRV